MLSPTVFAARYTASFEVTIRLLQSRGAEWDIAVELAQAAWARGWEHRAELRTEEMLTTWINTIALNLFRNSAKRRYEGISLNILQLPAPELRPETKLEAEQFLKRIPGYDRTLLYDFLFLGYTDKELAQRLQISPTAVRIRISRAKQRLRERIDRGKSKRIALCSSRARAPRSPA